jgi:hypothetical protein
MKYKIILEQSWMGDTLFACNVVKNLTDMGHDVDLFYHWPFMSELIKLFGIKAHLSYDGVDLEGCTPIRYNGRIDVFDNPLLDYAKCFNVPEAELEQASRFFPLDKPFRAKYPLDNPSVEYITFDHDWQNRTKYNVRGIVDELSKFIRVIPIGGDRGENPDHMIHTGALLANSKLHLGMVGGTTNFAAFMNTKIVGDTQHLYHFYKNNGEAHNYMEKESLTPEKFLDTFKPFPTHWADPKHIIVDPRTSESEYVNIVKNNLK